MSQATSLPATASGLTPHRRPMRLVDRVLRSNGADGEVDTVVTPDGPFTGEDGILDATAFPELIAQAYAAVVGYEHVLQDLPLPRGYLVGMQAVKILGQAGAGETLNIKVETVAEMDGFAVIQGQVLRADAVLAQGRIKVWNETPEAQCAAS